MAGGGHHLGSGQAALRALVAVGIVALFGGLGFSGVLGDNRVAGTFIAVGLVFAAVGVAFVVRRRRLAAGAAIGLEPVAPVVRRGERLDVRLQLPAGEADARDPEVTLRCRVSYVVIERDSDGDRVRRTRHATAWEHAVAARGGQPVQVVSFEVPRDVPYSYAGRVLAFRWELRALQKVRRGTDRLREAAVEVAP